MNAQVISPVNQKGGGTKTTSYVYLAAGLMQVGKKVLSIQAKNTLAKSIGNERFCSERGQFADKNYPMSRIDTLFRNFFWFSI